MKWTEAKRQGLCTRCNILKAEGERKILCGPCRDHLNAEHEKEAKPAEHRDYNNSRG